jgi:hypothetical protein
MVVIGFVQQYKPVAESSSPSAHTAGAASAGPVSTAGEQAALAAADIKLPSGLSAAALSAAKPAGGQNPAQMKAAYWASSRQWCALQSGCRRSAMMSSTTSSPTGRPSLPNCWKLDGEKLAAAKAEFKQLEEDDII